MLTLGEKIKKIRISNNLKQSELAEIFYEYYYDLGYEIRDKEDNEKYNNMVDECYEIYIKIYGENKDNDKIETVVRNYFKLDDEYKLYMIKEKTAIEIRSEII